MEQVSHKNSNLFFHEYETHFSEICLILKQHCLNNQKCLGNEVIFFTTSTPLSLKKICTSSCGGDLKGSRENPRTMKQLKVNIRKVLVEVEKCYEMRWFGA